MNRHFSGMEIQPARWGLPDTIFIVCAAFYAWLAFYGIGILSANGAMLDSDLQTYAQGMAGAAHPEQFAADPVLAHASEANSIPNLQRWLATLFVEQDNYGMALLKAGACAIFTFYACWYFLGRFLFLSPALAAILALFSGITIWTGWGTFWGLTHSDPVPRVFFAAIFPLLLMVAIRAWRNIYLRPAALLLCGISMWIHGVSSLNCGAMFLTAFLFCRQKKESLQKHIIIFILSCACFLVPVLFYLWPSLSTGHTFRPEELRMFQEMQAMRWQADFTGFWPRMIAFFSPVSPTFIPIICGLASWLLLTGKNNPRFYPLWQMIPYFILALFCVACFSWLEDNLASKLGRPGMGHELVRGMRFIIPLAWLLVTALIAAHSTKWARRAILALLICALGIFNHDRQQVAVETALSSIFHLPLPRAADAEIAKATAENEIMAAIKEFVPPGESIFCPEDQMPVRYLALRSLDHSFKDGYVFFYNKEAEASARWLQIEKALHTDGPIRAWQISKAPWLLAPRDQLSADMNLKPVFDIHGWVLARMPEN